MCTRNKLENGLDEACREFKMQHRTAVRFYPPRETDTPRALFSHNNEQSAAQNRPGGHFRFTRLEDANEVLIYTDGSCVGQGGTEANSTRRAGCAFVYECQVGV